MWSDLIDERVKGFRYADEPHRFRMLSTENFLFEGHHSQHHLLLEEGVWVCDCNAYQRTGILRGGNWCRHTIALERILANRYSNALAPSLMGVG